MPEALTESFCERCGTRYEFTAPTRLNPLRKGRGLVTGLKNYIMSQDALSDTVGDAMRSEAEALAASQLDAFHAAFNFCIDCRQYTCTNCWNDAAGRCRSCVPIAGTDDLLERFEASFVAQHPATNGAGVAEMEAADLAGRLGIEAWPSADPVQARDAEGWPSEPLPAEATPAFDEVPLPELEPEPEPVAFEQPEPEPVVAEAPIDVPLPEPEPEPVAFEQPAPEPVVAEVSLPEPEPEPEPVAFEQPEPEPVVAEAPIEVPLPEPETPPTLTVLHWEPDTEFELLPEPVIEQPKPVVVEAIPEPEPVIFEQPEPAVLEAPVEEALPAPEPVEEPIAASAPEPEPLPETPPTPRPSIRPIGDTILRMPAPRAPEPIADRQPLAADDPMAAARRAQLDLLGLDDPGQGIVRPERPQALPYRSSGAALPTGDLAQRAARNRGTSAFWDASAREVADAMSAVGVQSCGSCGLSLSATARFCRRCGTRQAQPA